MQEFIVLSIAITALVYLFIKFFAKRKPHNCDDCGIANNESKKH